VDIRIRKMLKAAEGFQSPVLVGPANWELKAEDHFLRGL
jgi:hypothetical protein